MAKRLCLDPTAGASSDSSSGSAGATYSSSFDSASASSSASSSGNYTLVCQCGYVTSVPHPLTRYFNFLGKTLPVIKSIACLARCTISRARTIGSCYDSYTRSLVSGAMLNVLL